MVFPKKGIKTQPMGRKSFVSPRIGKQKTNFQKNVKERTASRFLGPIRFNSQKAMKKSRSNRLKEVFVEIGVLSHTKGFKRLLILTSLCLPLHVNNNNNNNNTQAPHPSDGPTTR